MKINKKWTSIIESIIVLLIVVMWIVWTYTIFTSSQKLSNTTQNRLEAIQIAREWLEAISNIRDTNWLMFSANYENCFMTLNYDANCITADDSDIWSIVIGSWSYIIYQDSDNRWRVESKTLWSWFDDDYRGKFLVFVDNNWFYTQSWSTLDTSPLFTRELIINPDTSDTPPQKYEIESIVRWIDSSRSDYHQVKLNMTLTNWKNKQ